MPRLRQMPELYLRGALANETMRHLTPEQREEADQIIRKVMDDPRLAPNRAEFIKQLGRTIGGDYKEDRDTADQEYRIAIWRGVIQLLHHRAYSFRCANCQNTHYLTQRRKPTPLDRRYPICPACGVVEIVDPGDTGLQPGQFVRMSHDDPDQVTLQTLVRALLPLQRPAIHRSPVRPVPGEKKIQDPEAVLNDPVQLHKFFSEFIWNYFRQMLNENEIQHHRKTPIKEYGPADHVAVLEICSLLGRLRVQYYYCDHSEPTEGRYHIYTKPSTTPPEFTAEFSEIIRRYAVYGVGIDYTEQEISVTSKASLPFVEALVIKPSLVLVQASKTSIQNDSEDSSLFDRFDFRSTKDKTMARIEIEETLDAIGDALPDGDCRITYDIIRGRGEHWDAFSSRYPAVSLPKPGHIAAYLGTNSNVIKQYIQHIKVHCLAHHLVEGRSREDED